MLSTMWHWYGGCVYFRKTAKLRQTNGLSDPGVWRDVAKGGDMKISSGNVGQCWGLELGSLANLVIAWRESFSKRASVDLSFRYCLDAA